MAENPTISYLDAEGATQTTTTYSFVSDSTSAVTWTTGTYVVGADYDCDGDIDGDDATYAKVNDKQTEFTISDTVTLAGHAQVTLIIADGFSLSISSKDAEAGQSATAAINEEATYAEMYLTVTAQSIGDDAGKLSVTGGKGGTGIATIGMYGGNGATLTKLIVNAGNVTLSGGQGGQGGVDDDKGKDGGDGGTALYAENLIVNNGTLILHGGKGGEGGNGDEGQGKTGVTKMGAMITMYQPAIKNGVLIADGGAATGAFMALKGAITDGNGNTVTMYDLNSNELSFESRTYKYGGAIATPIANVTPFDLVSVSSLGEQGGVTFTVDGTETTKAWAGTTVTVAEVAVEGYYITGFSSDQVTITDNTFTMPETAVTVTATYAAYDDRIVVNTTTYPEDCTLTTGKTYKAAPYEGKGGFAEVQNGGTLNTNGASFSGNSVTRSQDDGGAIHNQGTVNVSGGSFSSNSARHDGGAIYNKGGTTDISGTDFTGNYAKVLGGAITTSGGKLNITSATFADNVAGSNGGAIFNSSGCVATLTDVAFFANAAKGIYANEGGGAIENTRGGVMTLSNVTFNGNTTAGKGGAIFNYTLGTINLTGSVDLQTDTDTWVNEGYYNSYYETEENSVVNWDLTGVTDPAQSTVTINGFQRYSNKKTDVNGEQKVLVNQTITVNAEGAQAAGKYVIASGDFDLAKLTENNSTAFTVTDGATTTDTITVNGTAGVIGNQGYKLALVESEEAGADQLVLSVINYTADRIVVNEENYPPDGICTLDTGKTYTAKPYEGKGGAFYLEKNATLTGKDVTFADNTVTSTSNGRGGAIFVCETTVINLDGDIVFSGNTAHRCGGAIFGSYNSQTRTGTTINFTGNSVRFINNVAKTSDAGAINLSLYSTLTVDSSAEFSGNSAAGEGGALWTGGATTTFNSTVDFSNNTAGTNGGAICGYFYTVDNIVTLNDTATFTGNSATGNGGAIYNKQGTVNLNGETTFTGNTAGANGGAIYNQGTITINGAATFTGNTVTGGSSKGGAIFNAVNSTLNMANTVTLATETDTVYNGGTLNWDLTGETAGKLEGYQYLDNDGGTLQITVKDSDKDGDKYVIATGGMSDLTGKDTFTLTGVDGQSEVTLTVNDKGGIKTYNGQGYKLSTTGSGDDGELVLSVVHDYTLVLKDGQAYKSYDNGTTLGDTVTLEGLTFAGGVWTMDNFTFETCAATAVKIGQGLSVTITVTGDNVITGGDSATTKTIGLDVTPDLTLKGSGSLTVTAGDAASRNSIGLYASQKLDVSGITLNVSSGAAPSDTSKAIILESFTVTDAFVTANQGACFMPDSVLTLSTTLSVKGYGKITATSAMSDSFAVSGASEEPDAGAQWNGTVLVWDSTYYHSYMNGSDVAANAILTKTYDERGRIVVNQGATDTLGQQGTQTVYTVAPCTNDNGGAVKNEGTFTATNITFANNVVTGENKGGGAIYSTGTMIFKGDTKFIGNSAAKNVGGAIRISEGSATFEEVEFTGNMAGKDGGAITNAGEVSITGDAVTFTGNTAGANGGAIYNDAFAVMNITGDTVTFTGNTAGNDDDYGGAIFNSYEGTVNISGDTVTFTGNTVGTYGGAIFNGAGTLNLNGKTTFSGNTVTGEDGKGGAIYSSGKVNMANTVTLATATDTVYNQGTLNWNLTGDTTGKLEGYQYLTNNTGTLTITVNEKQTKGDYTLATGDMTGYDTDETGKYTFKLTGIAGTADVDIKVGDEKVNYGTDILYSLYIDDKGNTDATDDELVLKVAGLLGAEVDDSMVGKWFKAGETITITGTYDGDDITSFTFGGNNVTYSDGTWSYTFTSHADTKGTDYDIVISTADESETTTYTLLVDTVAPSVENTAFAGDTKYVDTATGKTWFKQGDTTAALASVITDETSGLGTVTYNDIAYDETGSKFVLSTASEVDVDAQTIQAADAAGNENNTVAVGAYGVDGTEPTVDTIYTSAFKADSVYVDANYNVWVKQNDTLSVDVTITDEKSGLKNAVAAPASGTSIEYKDGAFSNLDTSTEVAWGTRYNITATDNVGNENTSATLKYGVDGTGPAITLKNAVTATVCDNLTPTGAPDSANVTKTTDTVASGTDMSGAYTSKWFSAVDTSYTITISDQILKSVTVNGAEQTLSGTSFEYTFNPEQGENVFEIVATDGVGNETTSTITLNYDSEAPVFAANSLTVQGVEYAGQDLATAKDSPVVVSDITSFTVTLNATDVSTLTNSYSFSADGTGSWSEWTVFSADAPITTGEGYYRFATVDAVGNTAIADKYFYIGRPIEYTLSDSVDVIYDGQEHGITVTITDPEDGIGASVYYSLDGGANWTLTGDSAYKITDATVDGTVSVCFKIEAAGYVTAYSESRTITIDPKRLFVSGTTADDKMYDGTVDATVHAGTLFGVVEGDDVTLVAEGHFNSADAGARKTVTALYTLEGEDSHNYKTIVAESVGAAITKRQVILESDSASKVYDGAPLTCNTVTVSGDGWADGEGAAYNVTGSQTMPGSSANTFTYTLDEGTNGANYDITTISGTLSDLVDKNVYDELIADLSFDYPEESGALPVESSIGNALSTDDIDILMANEGVNNVDFHQDMVDIRKLTLNDAGVSKTISFQDGFGTDKNDKIVFARNSEVVFGQDGYEINLLDGNNKVQIEKDATTVINASLVNVNSVKSASGSSVTLADIDFQDGGNATLEAMGSSFVAGNIDFGVGNDKLVTGKNTCFEADSVTSAETISFGACSQVNVTEIASAKTLTVGNGKEGNSATLNVSSLTGTTANDSFNFGNWNNVVLGSLDFGDGNDTLKIGNYAEVEIANLDFGDGAKDRLAIGKGATLTLDELDVDSLDMLSMGKGAMLCLGDDSYDAAMETEWGQKYSAQISRLA